MTSSCNKISLVESSLLIAARAQLRPARVHRVRLLLLLEPLLVFTVKTKKGNAFKEGQKLVNFE